MKTSITGYKKNSKDKNEPVLKIPSGKITMKNVPHPVIAQLDDGSIHIMYPEQEYNFNSKSVIETPIKQKGGIVDAGLPQVNAIDYQIKKGETLGAIAKKYNISVSELAEINKIDNPNKIKENQKIVIPQNSKSSFSKNDLLQAYKSNKPITYDNKKLYQGLDESKIDNHQIILDYHKKNSGTPYTIIDKKSNTLYQYDENNNLVNQFRVGLGKDQSDKYTINSKNKKIDRNVTGAGIYSTVPRGPHESHAHDYDNNIVLLENERGSRQAMSIHQIPNNLKEQRSKLLNDTDLTNDDFSNGCINCNKDQFEKYNKIVKPGQKVYVLPEEEGNYFTVKDDKLTFTANRNKEFGQYNFSPKNEEYKPLDIKSSNPSDYKNQFIQALSHEKNKLMKDLKLSSKEYDELAKRAYGIFGQESSFGKGSWNPKNNYNLERIYTKLFDSNEERQSRSLGLTQIRMKNINPGFAQKYGINEDTLYNPYQSALATMERLTDAYQAVKQPNVRDKYKDLTPENVYDYATTFYNKPETVRLGKASGNNSYVQNVNRYASELQPNNQKQLIAQAQTKFKSGGQINNNMKQKYNPREFESFLSQLPDTDQDNLIDYMEGLADEDRTKFLCGGTAHWKKFQFRYQQGGNVTTPVEVEGDETVQKTNGELYKFNGPKHSQGGIDVQLEPGSKIFSEYTKAEPEIVKAILGKESKKKLSYADLSKKFDTTKHAKALQNPDSDKYEKETARVKFSNNAAMLETIFTAQEVSKSKKGEKNIFQMGGPITSGSKQLSPNDLNTIDSLNETPLERLKRMYQPNQNQNWTDWGFGQEGQQPRRAFPQMDTPENVSPDLGSQFPTVHQEPSSTVTTGLVLPVDMNKEYATPKSSSIFDLVNPNRSSVAPVPTSTIASTKPSVGGKKPGRAVSTKPLTTNHLSNFGNFDPLPMRNSGQVSSLKSGQSGQSRQDDSINTEDYKVTPIEQDFTGRESGFGINPKLAGTILDIGLAASDKLKVINPQYRDLRKYPLFSRFVDFDDKEAGRNMALNIQQIQNSNMPEEVKQARIADLNAQYKDYTAKIDFGNAQRYEQKIGQDTEKLQNYLNSNIDQHYQDIETYNQKKARVDFLKDQFNAQKKSRIVNSLKAYAEYVDDTTMKNALAHQLYGESYSSNVLTGKIDRIKGQQDPFLKQERGLSQYAQQNNNVKNLPNGATLTMISPTHGIVVDANGKTEIINLNNK